MGAPLVRITDYGTVNGRPDLGFGYHYIVPGRMIASIYAYKLGLSPPAGPDSPMVAGQYAQARNDIRLAIQLGKYRDATLPDAEDRCSYGNFVFRCLAFRAIGPAGDRVVGRLLVTGARRHFVKIRVDWGLTAAASVLHMEMFLNTLAEEMAR